MDHNGAIAQFIMPLLLAVLCALASYGLYMTRQLIRKLEQEHDALRARDDKLEARDERLAETGNQTLARLIYLEASQKETNMDHERRLAFCENELTRKGRAA